MSEVRVRFAPSPTGMLHPGGARTALFNYLFARFHGGGLVLRIEDTDLARSTSGFERSQLEDLEWLGLSFDEGPYRQSERGAMYAAALERLSGSGLTYEAEDESGRKAIYFRPPTRSGSFRDELRGEVKFSRVADFVLMKSDGTPSYNFAAVVDDAEMGITHVIRGEEHISNAGRQALLYQVLGETEPKFVHLGLILGPDGKKLSKRHGAASVREYRDAGYLPEAFANHLALLGWTHPDGKEFFPDLASLSQEWSPSRLGASPAVFDTERLLTLNAEHIRSLSPAELWPIVEPLLEKPPPEDKELLAVEAIQEDMKLLTEATRLLEELVGEVDSARFAEGLPESSEEVFLHTVSELKDRELADLDEARVFVKELRAWAKETGIKTRDLLHPLRLALTGRNRGPEMGYLFAILGPEESRVRIEQAREARLGT